MAMAACAAKFRTSAICLSSNGLDFLPIDPDGPDQIVFPQHRDLQKRPHAPEFADGDHPRIPAPT